MSNMNWNSQCIRVAYRRTSMTAVVLHARSLVAARAIDGTDFTAKPATAASGPRTWSPPIC